MILKIFVRFASHVKIVPDDLPIVSTQNEIVSAWVHTYRRDPFGTRLEFSHHLLFLKVVLKHLNMGASEEMRLRRVEADRLNNTFGLSEWSSRGGTAQTVNHHLTRSLNIMSHGGEVITLRMPNNFTDHMVEFHLNHQSSFAIVVQEFPFDEFFLLVTSFLVNVILLLPIFHIDFGVRIGVLGIKHRLDDINLFFV